MMRIVLIVLCLAFPCIARASDTGKPTLVLDAEGHTDGINGLVFTPDGKLLLSASRDKTIRVWDVKTGTMLRVLRLPIGIGQEGILSSIAISPDGQFLAAARETQPEAENEIYVIDLATGRVEQLLKGHVGPVYKVTFSPDGRRLASGGSDRIIHIWRWPTGTLEQTLKGHAGSISDLAFSPDSRQLVSGAFDTICARIWSLETGKPVADLKEAFEGNFYAARKVAWSPDGQLVATATTNSNLYLWNADGGLRKRYSSLPYYWFGSMFFTPDTQQVLIQNYLFNLDTGKESVSFTGHVHGSFQNVLSPDGTLAATGGFHGDELSLWRTADGSQVHRLKGKGKTNWSAGFGPDGSTIAWGNIGADSRQNSLYPLERAFQLADLEFSKDLNIRFERAQAVRESLNLVRAVPPQSAVFVKDGERTVSILKRSSLSINCWTFLPRRDCAVISGFFGVYLCDIKTGEILRSFHGHTGDVRALAPAPDGRYFLTASSDQTLRIWAPDRNEPIVSLFFADNDWIVWTPEGYYAASPGGERLMGWQVNNGPNQMGSFFPATQFRKTLYRPDVIKLLLKVGSVENALAAADKERGKVTQLTEVAEVLPPFVIITSPAKAKIELTDEEVEIRFIAKKVGNHSIKSVRLLLDGRPYTEAIKTFDQPIAGEVRDSWTIKLAPGRHTVAVVAETAVSKGTSEPVEIFLGARGLTREDATPDEVRQALQPSLYILAIGISEYPGNLKLNYAAKDATVLAQTYERYSKELYKKVDVKLIVDKDATRKEILGGLTWLRKSMTQNDVGIVFFAGHGGKDADGSFYLFPVDVDPDDLLSTGVPGDQLKKTLAGIPSRVVVLLDACHSGGIDGDKRRSSPTDDLVRDLGTDEVGVIVMCSSTGREFSLESGTVEHGFFTLALIEGLSGKATRGTEGAIYLHHLDVFVKDKVKELSKGKQHPVSNFATMRSFPISKP